MQNENMIAIYIISPNILKEKILKRLNENQFECTLLSTTGAYLRAGQTAVLTITEKGNVPKLREIIEETKKFHNDNYAEKVRGILIFSVPVIDFEVM